MLWVIVAAFVGELLLLVARCVLELGHAGILYQELIEGFLGLLFLLQGQVGVAVVKVRLLVLVLELKFIVL